MPQLVLNDGVESTRWTAFWDAVDATGPCWLWTGGRMNNGYGYFSDTLAAPPRKTWLTHRIAYVTLVGPMNGLVIDHLCRIRHCVNPDHMEPVTRGENVLRGYGQSAQNAAKTHCKWGHEFTDANTHVRRSGQRECRKCIVRRARSYRS